MVNPKVALANWPVMDPSRPVRPSASGRNGDDPHRHPARPETSSVLRVTAPLDPVQSGDRGGHPLAGWPGFPFPGS